MVWKAGETVSVPVRLEEADGTPIVYADKAAFLAAGWTIVFYQEATPLVTQPTWDFLPIGSTGVFAFEFVLPLAGEYHALITPPADELANPYSIGFNSTDYDIDSAYLLLASMASPITVPVSGYNSGAQVQDISSVEGKSIQAEFQIGVDQLRILDSTGKLIYQFADLSDIGGVEWTVAAKAREQTPAGQLPSSSVAYEFTAVITSKTERKVAIGWKTAPVGAVVSASDGSIPSKTFLYDVVLTTPSGTGITYSGYKLAVVKGTHTIIRQQTTP
jgi:hypothetical protein